MHIDQERVKAIAAIVAGLPSQQGLNFHSFRAGDKEIVASDMYPPIDAPCAVDFFFFVCLQNFGFWRGDAAGYREPVHGTVDGKVCKGSDLLWKLCLRAFTDDPYVFAAYRLARCRDSFCEDVFRDDAGELPFPQMRRRLAMTRGYGGDMFGRYRASAAMVTQANGSGAPLMFFLDAMRTITGFTDPLRKKALLLAMALANRPERFLRADADDPAWAPVVDYHLMRVALRTGMVVLEGEDATKNASRAWATTGAHDAIRTATRDVVQMVTDLSGRTHAAIDLAFWSARRYCPEMTEPDCGKCALSPACAKRTAFFQPVFMTTDY